MCYFGGLCNSALYFFSLMRIFYQLWSPILLSFSHRLSSILKRCPFGCCWAEVTSVVFCV